jgi:hypothetical protein
MQTILGAGGVIGDEILNKYVSFIINFLISLSEFLFTLYCWLKRHY